MSKSNHPRPGTKRRRVYVSRRNTGKGTPKLWAFGLPDFADLFDTTIPEIRKFLSNGVFDPRSLESICEEYYRRKSGEVVSTYNDTAASSSV